MTGRDTAAPRPVAAGVHRTRLATMELALPLVLVVLALGLAANVTLALVLLAAIALAVAAGPRWDVDPGRQILSSAIGAGAGYLLCSLLYEPERNHLSDGWAKLCASALLAAAARVLLIAPRGGHAPLLGLAFVALACAGKTPRALYPGIAVAFILAAVHLLADGQRPLARSSRRFWAGAGVLALAAALGGAATLGLRQLAGWAHGRARYSMNPWRPRTGFSERMELGALDGLLDSEQRVLRVFGGRTDYLRGAVLDVYEGGRWRKSEAAERARELELDAEPGPGAIRIEAADVPGSRFFIPLAAARLRATPSTVLVDDLGGVRAPARSKAVSVLLSPGIRDRAAPGAPRPNDLGLPRRVRRRLAALAAEWTLGATTPAERLRALQSRLLSGYGYARAFDRGMNNDPVLDFLFEHRRGHCEYFASALTLLARAVGVPARIVMGYRVSERSPFGYWVVREHDAHAWVEAWLPGEGWTTFDATPPDAQPWSRERTASYAASSADALGVAYDDLTEWLGERSLLETSLAWLAGCAVLGVIVARGARRRRRHDAPPADEALLPFMAPLLEALEQRGHRREPHEPLERLAARLPDAEREPAQLLARYSALRYGGLGDADALSRDVASQAPARRGAARAARRQRS